MSQQEKRKSTRVPLKIKVDCQYEGNFLFEYATDISQHGIFLQSESPMPMGSEVSLQFSLPDSDQSVEVLGEVAWINEKSETSRNPGMGIRFTRINDLDKETITALVKRLAVL